MKLCHSQPFDSGVCRAGPALWLGVAGATATWLAAGLTVPAHRATQGGKAR